MRLALERSVAEQLLQVKGRPARTDHFRREGVPQAMHTHWLADFELPQETVHPPARAPGSTDCGRVMREEQRPEGRGRRGAGDPDQRRNQRRTRGCAGGE
jgi:hypothetical protein